jgi:hypothetical protein
MTAAAAARTVHQGRNRRSRGGRLLGGRVGPGVSPKASGFRWVDYSYPPKGTLRKAAPIAHSRVRTNAHESPVFIGDSAFLRIPLTGDRAESIFPFPRKGWFFPRARFSAERSSPEGTEASQIVVDRAQIIRILNGPSQGWTCRSRRKYGAASGGWEIPGGTVP